MVWAVFALAAFAIFLAGAALARHGAVISRHTGISQIWVGALLVAAVTSMPEITTDLTAVLRDDPELATGDLFGSNMANMAVLAIVALAYGRARVIQREALGIVLTAAVAIILTTLAVLFVVVDLEVDIAGSFGVGSIVLLVTLAAALLLLPDVREMVGERAEVPEGHPRMRTAVLVFGAAAATVLVAGPLLVAAAEEIVDITGLSATFVGVLGLAIATSLPELATSSAAVRSGDLDLAVGNLYGSNAINMAILVLLDAVYTQAPLLDSVHISNAVAGLVAVLLMMVALTGTVLRTHRRRSRVDPIAIVILAGYVLGTLLVWTVSEQ